MYELHFSFRCQWKMVPLCYANAAENEYFMCTAEAALNSVLHVVKSRI
jgi:hypothetical protein